MSVRVRGSAEFQSTVLRYLQCLDREITYLNADRRDVSESAVVFDATISPSGPTAHPKTRQLLRSLIDAPYPVLIVHTGGGSECVPADRHHMPAGSTVQWNPQQRLPGAMACCPCICLGHELCHSLQLIRGDIHPSEFYGGQAAKMRYEMLAITGRYGSDRIGPGAVTENDLRQEHVPRQSLRTSL